MRKESSQKTDGDHMKRRHQILFNILVLAKYNACLHMSLQAIKVQLKGNPDRDLVIHYEIAAFSKGKPNFETHLKLPKLYRERFESLRREAIETVPEIRSQRQTSEQASSFMRPLLQRFEQGGASSEQAGSSGGA